MKTYFAKYLPVEGELKEGDITYWDSNEGYFSKQFVKVAKSFETHAIASGWKKFKLFLCSRDIQVGDKVFSSKVSYLTQDETITVDEYNITICREEEDFKVIGEISPEATWVKEGDEFDESQFIRYGLLQMGKNRVRCNDEMDQRYLTGYEVSTQCPTCKKFH
jgi:hypothetical protein